MGTSGTHRGSKSGLVPTWVDEPASKPVALPVGGGDNLQDGGFDDEGDDNEVPTSYPPIPENPADSGLGVARGNMTRGARTSDAGAIHRSAGMYVGTGGGGRAISRRMSNSRAVAGRVVNLVSSFADRGPVETLRLFDLVEMAGAPAEDVFIALIDILCPAGGTIDEAIARDAMLETVADFAAVGVGNFDELSTDDLHEFFIGVVTHSIEGKILSEVGTNAVSVPANIAGVEQAQNMLHDFIQGCVRDQFGELGADLDNLDGVAIDSFVDDLYSAALDLVQAIGENE